MIYPTVEQLTEGKFNRYELVVGVAKCARIVTDEYIEMRTKAPRSPLRLSLIPSTRIRRPLRSLLQSSRRADSRWLTPRSLTDLGTLYVLRGISP